MPNLYKVLGQSSPSATTNTDIYTVPSGRSAVISSITVCNRDSTAATYRIAVRVAGSAISNEEYIAFGTTVNGNDTITLSIGMTLAATDVLTVYSSNTNLSFNVFGSEIF